MMATYLEAYLRKAQHEIDYTGWFHARFSFLVDLYEHHLSTSVDADGDDA